MDRNEQRSDDSSPSDVENDGDGNGERLRTTGGAGTTEEYNCGREQEILATKQTVPSSPKRKGQKRRIVATPKEKSARPPKGPKVVKPKYTGAPTSLIAASSSSANRASSSGAGGYVSDLPPSSDGADHGQGFTVHGDVPDRPADRINLSVSALEDSSDDD